MAYGVSTPYILCTSFVHPLAMPIQPKPEAAIWAWGLNSYGQLGNGTTSNSSTPVQVSNLTNGVMISGGVDHSIATTTAGLAWDWGNNQFGQLGNGTTANSSTPVQVSNLTSV